MNKIYTCNNFDGYYPVGSAAVIVADNKYEAKSLLLATLENMLLPQEDGLQIIEVDTNKKQVVILRDGDY
jgi:hypothetical protein